MRSEPSECSQFTYNYNSIRQWKVFPLLHEPKLSIRYVHRGSIDVATGEYLVDKLEEHSAVTEKHSLLLPATTC